MSESKKPTCAMAELRRIDPEFAQMIASARAEASAHRRLSPANAPHSAARGGSNQGSRLPPVIPRVYVATGWPAPMSRSAAPLARGMAQAIASNPRPWSDYVNGATLVRAYIASEVLTGDSARAQRAQTLQYYIDSAFWAGNARPWTHDQAPMTEAYWLRMPVSRVSSIELRNFIEAHRGACSSTLLTQRMGMLDKALLTARERHGASVRFSLVRQLEITLRNRLDAHHAA